MLYSFVLLVFLFGPLASGQGPLPCVGEPLACAIQIERFRPPSLESRRADCSSYQLVTVTPDPTTITTTVETVTVTVTVEPGFTALRRNDIAARAVTVTPTATPTYVFGPCTDEGVYGSACACIGIPRTTTTEPTPTSTVSVTETVTTTVAAQPDGVARTCGNYLVVSCDTPAGYCACGSNTDGHAVCFEGAGCPAASCTSNAECGAGYACAVNTCCVRNVCIPLAPGQCNLVPLMESGAGPSQRGGGSVTPLE
ncbi:hypothetical protein BJX64DRAFT_290963 [Aspergillus heterothallicus]